MKINLASPREIKKIMTEFCLQPSKKWGQNFLADANIVRKIVTEVDLQPGDHVVEIGAGLGVLTLPLSQGADRVIAIEIDRGLVRFLRQLFSSPTNVTLVEDDVRELNMEDLCNSVWGSEKRSVKLVGNLPYYISSLFIYELLEGDIFWRKAVFMLQKEVAERIVAPVSTPIYGSLSVLSQCYLDLKIAFNVPPNVFYPVPEVDSTVLVAKPKIVLPDMGDKTLFKKLVTGVFKYRRKTLLNSLGYCFGYEKPYLTSLLKEAQIDPQQRPESLAVAEFANLCRLIYNASDRQS
ncbi:MAG: ribosomal RNA small subunit methyltransferase A [Firmicutes bacterium]|jgi:16S rRNA (adenine1518-N6/adenine1519-N6)-dimethyltransferase|nr:ribosomal RNA small subunit methyltransferase A [Bacillota bacterium]